MEKVKSGELGDEGTSEQLAQEPARSCKNLLPDVEHGACKVSHRTSQSWTGYLFHCRGKQEVGDYSSQVQQVYGLMVVTGHNAERTTLSATLPNMIFSRPLYPWVPMIIISARTSVA